MTSQSLPFGSYSLPAVLLAVLLAGALTNSPVQAQSAFVTTWETSSSNETITIPTSDNNAPDYNFTIKWGDGTEETYTGPDPDPSHTYASAGPHTVEITGTFPRIHFNGTSGSVNAITGVTQWGNIQWSTMEGAFEGASNLDISASDSPDLSNVTDMSTMFLGASSLTATGSNIGSWNTGNVTDMRGMFAGAGDFNQDIGGWNTGNVSNMFAMFRDATSFNQDIGGWDTGNVSNMRELFSGAENFNQDIGGWDTGNVSNMRGMFANATSFNQDIGSWDTGNVSNMREMFRGADSFNQNLSGWDTGNVSNMRAMFQSADNFNQDINTWNVSNVSNMRSMFSNATSFNQDIGAWNVSNVSTMRSMFFSASSFNQDIGAWETGNISNMRQMFDGAASFNQDIGGWDVSSVSTMDSMFEGATSFNQDISLWDVSNVSNMNNMLDNTNLSTTHYDRLLISWARRDVESLSLGANGVSYCDGGPFRAHLENEFGWTFFDDTQASGCPDQLVGSGAQNVSSNSTVAFGDTDVRIAFSNVGNSGRVTVGRFGDEPRNVSGISEPNVSPYRIIVVAGPDLNFSDQTEVRFKASAFSGINDPSRITVYSRPQTGSGSFTALPTSYDSDSDEIVATTGSFSELVFASGPPETVTAQVDRSFGDASGPDNYRLVALPGQVSEPISSVVDGESGREWQAYLDNGSSSDFLKKFDGSDAFTFKTGNGFWLTSIQDWQSNLEVSTVNLQSGVAEINNLQDGWNIISNPLDQDVAWSDVETENGGSLKAIWSFNGTFSQTSTFASAKDGTAYYFLNDQGLNSLKIPYPFALEKSAPLQAAPSAQSGTTLSISATPAGDDDAPRSTVRVGLKNEARLGIGPEDVVGPPGRFETVSLRIVAPTTDKTETQNARFRRLMTEHRPTSEMGDGYTFSLRLQDRIEGPVTLSTQNVEAMNHSVSLLRPSTGESYDLSSQKTVRVTPPEDGGAERLKLAIGTDAYVKNQSESVAPSEVTLTSYPNPVQNNGTFVYTLPEATEVTLRLYDTLGRRVTTLVQGRRDAGKHTVQLSGSKLSSGVYFGRLRAAGRTLTQKMIVAR
jgi:surface protein